MKMMVIDDEKGICDFLSDFFERRGHEVVTLNDPLKAMDKIEKEQPQVVILDRIMPKMDGLNLLEKIKHAYGKKLKVIMVTVSDEEETRKKALKLGADDFIAKPFSSEYLESVVVEKIRELI